MEDVSEVFQPQTLQELVDGHVEQSCGDTEMSAVKHIQTTSVTPLQQKEPASDSYVHSPSFLSDPDAPSAGPVAPPTVMSPRGVDRLSMLLAADKQDGEGEGEMTTPPVAPVLTTLALT